MPRAPPAGFYILSGIALFVWYILWTHNTFGSKPGVANVGSFQSGAKSTPNLVDVPKVDISLDSTSGDAIMGKLGNETAKAELGRAAWKVLHTTMARFPDKPTADESQALKDYLHLFARLYPCGECARHFQQILKKYPPQVSSRSSAAAWACFVHNEVNISKGKPIFDCANIGDWYDCGCAEDEKEEIKAKGAKSEHIANGGDLVEIERDGLMNGG